MTASPAALVADVVPAADGPMVISLALNCRPSGGGGTLPETILPMEVAAALVEDDEVTT